MRQATVADRIGGFTVPKRAMITICPWVTYRHAAFWPDPERFDPERFAPEQVAARRRFAYIPFGGGPRLCIGNEFALMEAQLVLAMAVRRYRLRLAPRQVVVPECRLTLRPRGGLAMTLERA
jgi:cytochrome P450